MNHLEKKVIRVEVWKKQTDCLDVTEIPKKYLKKGYFLFTYEDDNGTIIGIEHNRLENDGEFNERLKKMNQSLKFQQKIEYEQYLKLKTKYEGNGK